MANPSQDVYADIAKLYAIVESLATSARMPQISSSGQNLKTSRTATGTTGTRGPTNTWGPFISGPTAPSVTTTVPASGRLSISLGAYINIHTPGGGIATEFVAIGAQISGVLAPESAAAILSHAGNGSDVAASVANSVIVEGLTPGSSVTVSTVFYHTSSTCTHYFVDAWLTVEPL